MEALDELLTFLLWAQGEAIVPTTLLVVLKVFGGFPWGWQWTLLPMASAGFFLAFFLCGLVILTLAHRMADWH